MLNKHPKLPVFFKLSFFLPASTLNILIKPGFRINRQHVRADQKRVQLIEYFRRGLCPGFTASLAGYAGQIEEAVFDTGLLQPPALLQNITGGISLAHE